MGKLTEARRADGGSALAVEEIISATSRQRRLGGAPGYYGRAVAGAVVCGAASPASSGEEKKFF
jgi:hypothetical protein